MHSLLCEATLSRRCEARCAGDVPRMTVMLPARVCLQAVINYINTKTESEWCAQNAAAPENTSGCPNSHGGHCFTFAVLRQLPNADFQIKKKIVEEVRLAVHCVIPPVVWCSCRNRQCE